MYDKRRYTYEYNRKRRRLKKSKLFEEVRFAGFIFYKCKIDGKLYSVSQAYELLKRLDG